MTDRKDINIDALRKLLLERKAELARLKEISVQSREIVELDQTLQGRLSRMDAMQQQEMAKETHRRREIDLRRIEAALKRMDGDDFGCCVTCDEAIAVKRIALDPAVPTCIRCASA